MKCSPNSGSITLRLVGCPMRYIVVSDQDRMDESDAGIFAALSGSSVETRKVGARAGLCRHLAEAMADGSGPNVSQGSDFHLALPKCPDRER